MENKKEKSNGALKEVEPDRLGTEARIMARDKNGASNVTQKWVEQDRSRMTMCSVQQPRIMGFRFNLRQISRHFSSLRLTVRTSNRTQLWGGRVGLWQELRSLSETNSSCGLNSSRGGGNFVA